MNKIVLVDGNNLLYRSYFATAYNGNLMKNSKGFATNALYGFINMLNKIVDDENPTHMMVAFDKGKTFRHDKFKDYKGTRAETPNELIEQFPLSRKICTSLGIKYLEIDNYEADDIIGTFARKIESLGEEALIVSSDKDLLQLISSHVKVKLLKTHDYIMMDEEEFKKTYGVSPIHMIDLKALMGDSSDNIPGVKGIGEKTAIKLLEEYKSLDNLYQNIDNIKGKIKEKLIEEKENAYLSYELATIYCNVPINTSLESIIKEDIHYDEYINILKELEFFSLLKKIDINKEKGNKKEFTFKIVNNLDELSLPDEYSLYLEIKGYNYHDAEALGVSIFGEDRAYYIPIELIKKSNIFSDNKKKYTYDLKKLLVIFDKYDIQIDKNIDDLMIEAYLLNKNIKNDISYLANQYDYDIPFYDKEFGSEITLHDVDIAEVSKNAVWKAKFLYDYRNIFLNELQKEEMLSLYQEMELPLVYVLAKMELYGFRVDRNYLLMMQAEIKEKMNSLEKDIYSLSNVEFNISSPKQLGDVLFNRMGIPYPKKIKDNNYSTSKEILDKLKGKEVIVDKVLEYRMYSKLYSNYIVGLIDEIKGDGKIHTIYNQTLTRTGRLSSERPNLQNIPIRIEEGRLIRKAFLPSNNDSILISSDYSQIELRVFAHMSHAVNMQNAFLNDLDIHTKTASDIYKVPIDQVDKTMRRNAKAVNFGIIYGISSFGLSEDLGINVFEAKDFIDNYLKTFPGIRDYMNEVVKKAYEDGYVKTLFNRKRVIDELKNKNYLIRSSGERMAMNAPIQGTAADIIKKAMIKIDEILEKENLNTKMLVQVHDELVFDVPDEEVEIVSKIIKDTMENICKLDVPLKVDIEYGRTWYEAK